MCKTLAMHTIWKICSGIFTAHGSEYLKQKKLTIIPPSSV